MRASLLSLLTAFLVVTLSACDSSSSGGSGGTNTNSRLRYRIELTESGSGSGSGSSLTETGAPSAQAETEVATDANGEITFATLPRAGTGVRGTYSLAVEGGGAFDPAIPLEGEFTGEYGTTGVLKLRITDPLIRDLGIELEGGLAIGRYSGTWSEITVRGNEQRGTFVAVVIEDDE